MKNELINTILFSGIVLLMWTNNAFSQSHYPGQQNDKMVVKDAVTVNASAFDLQDIKLLDSPFKENQEREIRWLLSLDNNRLLHSFKVNAGMATHAKALGGWEAPDVELRGHTMGHVLSGLALMYASTGNEAFKLKADSLVTELAKVQETLNQNGYLSAFPQNLINRAIAGEGVWAPWYTLHKIYAGLLDMYLYAGNKQALDVAEKMGNWAYNKLADVPQKQLDNMLNIEFGGVGETFYNLYAVSGDEKYLKLAKMFYHKAMLDPLANQTDMLQGHHANTYIPKIIAEARGYELTGNEKEKNIADFFWNRVVAHHTYATGGNSDYEYFFAPDSISKHITPRTTESCNTYNMLKLTRHLFTWSASEKYADYYEWALYNHILGSQDPETGMVCYFMPFKPGLFKVYSTPENSFWCCVGTGFENHAKYGEAIYYHNGNGLYVNLFIPSKLNWKEKGIKIKQETSYPEEDKTRITITSTNGKPFTVYLRYPSWATSGATVKINGRKQRVKSKAGSYIVLNRTWKNGDIIEAEYPMSLHLIPAPDDPSLDAIAYGPIILAGAMGNEGVTPPAPYARKQTDYENYSIPESIKNTINTKGKKVEEWIKPVVNSEPLTFEITDGTDGNPVKLIPYYRLHHQRYVMYWNLLSDGKK